MGETVEKKRSKKERTPKNEFYEACKKTCVECRDSLGDGITQISDVCFEKDGAKKDKKGRAVKVLGKTTRKIGDSFRENFEKVTFKSALIDTSLGVGRFFRKAGDVGAQFLSDLFS